MKRFLKKRWHSIPVALVTAVLLVCLISGSVFAAVVLSKTQTITQMITPIPTSSIDAPDINLDSVVVGAGGSVSQSFPNAVVVEVVADDAGKYLHLKLNTTSDLYEWCGVTLRSHAGDNPLTDLNLLINVTYGEIAGQPRDYPHCSVQLTEPGTYTFTETVGAIVGSTAGTAEVKVDITLEDDPAEENTEPF